VNDYNGGIMKVKYFLLAVVCLLLPTVYGCGDGGGGGAGLNGGITVTATATGTFVTATATYTNPTHSNLIGVPITFSARVGSQVIPLGTFNTNNSGSVAVAFSLLDFNGTQTVLVTASTGNLTNFATATVTGGRTLTLTPPPAIFANTSSATATVTVPIPIQPVFATFTDPFSNIGSLPILTLQITASAVSSLPGNTLAITGTSPVNITTNTSGIAPFPGATATMVVPATVGGTNVMTITWTVTDVSTSGGTGLSATGTTTITLTRSG
jgi:hypothetical protein